MVDEVLSQNEIDSLLKALSSGEIDTEQLKQEKEASRKHIVKYDFKRPNKYSKDHLRTLYMIHDNFSRMLSNFLSAYLRASVQIDIATVDQTTYEDFIVSVSSPTLMTMFNIKPNNETVIMVMNAGFLFPVIDLVFGGPGEMPTNFRDLTDIEVTVMRKLVERILSNLAYAWEGVYDIDPELVSLETNTQFTQLYSPTETIAVVTMTTNVAGHDSLINICLPYIALETIVSRLSAQNWFANIGTTGREDLRPKLTRQLYSTEVDVTVLLGSTQISVREFLQLGKQDVIPLDNLVTDNLELWVGHRKKFEAQPGIIHNKRGVYIKNIAASGSGAGFDADHMEEERDGEGGGSGE